MPAYAAYHAVDFVAGMKSCYAGTGFFNDAGHVEAEDCGQGLFGVGCLAGADFGVEGVHSAGLYADQDFACRGSGTRKVYSGEGAFGVFDDVGAHRRFSLAPWMKLRLEKSQETSGAKAPQILLVLCTG